MSIKNGIRGNLDTLMDNSDWALIFDSTGKIKGIFIPDSAGEDAEIPFPILQILNQEGINIDDVDEVMLH